MNERQEKIRVLIAWIDEQFARADIMKWLKRNPDLADRFWGNWEIFDRSLRGFLDGDIPIEEIRESAAMIIKLQ